MEVDDATLSVYNVARIPLGIDMYGGGERKKDDDDAVWRVFVEADRGLPTTGIWDFDFVAERRYNMLYSVIFMEWN